MKVYYIFLVLLLCDVQIIYTQNDTTPIPHKKFKDVLMYPQRRFIRMVTKEKTPFYDTSYIKAYKKNLVITIPMATKSLNFTLHDNIRNISMRFSPNNFYNVGININSNIASFMINTGITLFKDDKNKGKTNYKDLQFNLYGKKFTTDINFQLYQGFYVSNTQSILPKGVTFSAPYEKREDILALSLGVSSTYIFNYKKCSFRNAFTYTEQQKRSSGSFLLGGYYSLFFFGCDSSLVSPLFKSNFDSTAYVNAAFTQKAGINMGYTYTWVIRKKAYIMVALVNGIGLSKLNYIDEKNRNYNDNYKFSDKVSLRLGTGYDNGHFFTGLMLLSESLDYSVYEKVSFDYGYTNFKLFVGYRFNIQKQEHWLLKKLGLIEWNKAKS